MRPHKLGIGDREFDCLAFLREYPVLNWQDYVQITGDQDGQLLMAGMF
jgi:hypothetical protein